MEISKMRFGLGLFIAILLSCAIAMYIVYPNDEFVFDVLIAFGIAGGIEYGMDLINKLFKRKDKNPLLDPASSHNIHL
ncbi:MAG: hypothetical protein JWQ78_511 [Sediminibacterium sp.]|nr:hypothetical protein [Sediminibacterium sp.]